MKNIERYPHKAAFIYFRDPTNLSEKWHILIALGRFSFIEHYFHSQYLRWY